MIRDFEYLRAGSLPEALDYLARYGERAKILCGGQSLLILMRQGLVQPEFLIDIKGLEELNFVELTAEKGLRLGATTTHRTIEKSPLIKEHFPLLAEMEKNLASIQTRNWGTIGGNLAHADPAGDPAPVLIAMKAKVILQKKEEKRVLELEDFFLDFFETTLAPDELLREIEVPPIPEQTGVYYEKFTILKSDQGIVSVAGLINLDDGLRCREARIVLGGAAPKPLRAKKAEKVLCGEKIDSKLLEKAGEEASRESEPVSDIHASEEYRRYLVKFLVKKIVGRAWAKAKELAENKGG